LSRAEWVAALRDMPAATTFHSDEWLTVLEHAYGCPVLRLGFMAGDSLAGIMPVPVRRMLTYTIAGSRGLVTPYHGPLCRNVDAYPAVFETFWHVADAARWDFVEVAIAPDSPLARWQSPVNNVRHEVRQTICLDLARSATAVFEAMNAACRRAIRRAEKAGLDIRVVPAHDRDWIEPYWKMTVELYRRQHRPPAIPRPFYESLWDTFRNTGRLRILQALHRGEVIAGGIFLLDDGRLYYCDGASADASRELRPNNLIQWEIIRWAIAERYRTYDMVGADVPGIARFKLGFGGHLAPHPTFHRTRNWIARIGEIGYRRLMPVLRSATARLP
jgi:GNAT acetyltransferase-like protein